MLPRMVRQNRFRPCAERFTPAGNIHRPPPPLTAAVPQPVTFLRPSPQRAARRTTPKKPPHAVTSEKVRHAATPAVECPKNFSHLHVRKGASYCNIGGRIHKKHAHRHIRKGASYCNIGGRIHKKTAAPQRTALLLLAAQRPRFSPV